MIGARRSRRSRCGLRLLRVSRVRAVVRWAGALVGLCSVVLGVFRGEG